MLKLALIGVGRWGKNILKTLEGMEGISVDASNTSPPTPLLIKERGVQGVIIATPGSTHAKIALPYVKQGLPVFIEKPMATKLADAERLEKEAVKSGARIFTGHIHLYNPAYLKLKSLLKKIGKVRLIHFEGMGPGPVREDMSVLWDWGPHGVSMALDLLGKKPKAVSAFAPPGAGLRRDKAGKLAGTVFARLLFPLSVLSTMHLSWEWPEKRVRLTVIGQKGSLVFDDTETKKVALHLGDKVSYPSYSQALPLTRELEAFIRTVKTGETPVTDGQNGLEVVRVLSAAEESLKLK